MTQVVEQLPPVRPLDLRGMREKTIEILVEWAHAFRREDSLRVAVAGDGVGNVLVAGDNRNIYVRLDASDGPLAEARIDQWVPVEGDVIWLAKVNIFGTGGWIVIGQVLAADLPCY